MIHQNIKSMYYGMLRHASGPLRSAYRIHYRTLRKGCRKAHLGCGPCYWQGFINIDGNFQRKTDYLMDLRAGLPFPDGSLDFIYSCHMLEHLYPDEAESLLRECLRVLAPGGYLRLAVPDFDHIFEILAGRAVSKFPRPFKSAKGMAVNHLFCDGQHRYAYSEDMVAEIAANVGFSGVVRNQGADDPHFPGGRTDEPEGTLSMSLYRSQSGQGGSGP